MSNTTESLPLTLQPRSVERIWGENSLHSWYAQPQTGKPVGEVWLTAEECQVEGQAMTLGELVRMSPEQLGDEGHSGFPLLIKLLYPREKLSVQVHPNDAEALATLGQPRGKTECWYVLSAEPGAQVAVGFEVPMTQAEMRSAIEDGTIEHRLRYIQVKAGDMVFVDAGTVHAIGPGMVVLETQQYSDTTFRLWDYGRPRELHLDAGLAVARAETAAGLVEAQEMDGFRRLISCAYFTVDSFKSDTTLSYPLNQAGMQILIALGEGASICVNDESYPLAAGRAVVIPKGMAMLTLGVPARTEVVRVF